MAEPNEATFAALDGFDKRGDVLNVADLGEHADHAFICSTVQWAV